MMVWLVTQEPVILECKVKWALRSTAVNKANGCNKIPEELFKFLRDDAIRFCIPYVSKSGRPSSGHRTGKGQSSYQFSKQVVPKNVLTIGQLHSSPMLVRSCLKSCMLGFSIMWTKNFHQDRWEKHQQPAITVVCRWCPSNGRKRRGTREPLDEGEGGEWESAWD